MAKIIIDGTHRLKSGILSGTFHVEPDKVNDALRLELMKLEGVEAEIRPVPAQEGQGEPITAERILPFIGMLKATLDDLSEAVGLKMSAETNKELI